MSNIIEVIAKKIWGKRKVLLRHKFLTDIQSSFRSIDQQPFTTEIEDELDTLIEIEKAFRKAAKERFVVFYNELLVWVQQFDGFYSDPKGGCEIQFLYAEGSGVLRISSLRALKSRYLLIHSDGRYLIQEHEDFGDIIRFLHFITVCIKTEGSKA